MRCLYGVLSAVALLLASTTARAQGAKEAAAAKVLFDHGLDEMKQGHYPEGCSALTESYRMNPLPGALFTLAECEAKRGRIATAVKRYEEYVALFVSLSRDKQAKQHGRDVLSKEQIGILTAKLPRVTFLLGSRAPEGVEATLDGVPLDRAALGGPIPIDPGDHVVFARAPEGAQVEQRFSIDKGEQKTVALSLEPKAAPAPEAPPGPSGLRIGAYAAFGVGGALVVVGAITGGLALGKKSAVQAGCTLDSAHGVATCNQAGLDAGHAATTLGAASTGTFVVGAVALGAGVGLLVAAPPAQKTGRSAPAFRIGILSASPERAILGTEGAW